MLKLPFKILPKPTTTHTLGDEEIGQLEIPKLNDLSPNERIFIREQTREQPDLRSSAVKMARTIATKSGQKLLDVYNALTSGNTEELGEYLEEFIEFQDLMDKTSTHRRLVMATAVLKYRLVPDWELADTGDANQIHPKLVDAIADFAQKEESGWNTEVIPLTEEDLGKQQSQKNPTGVKSTGELTTTGKETKDLVPVGSDSKPPF